MTGYTVHTGSTKKFASNWDEIFKAKAAETTKSAAANTTPQKATKGATKKPGKTKQS